MAATTDFTKHAGTHVHYYIHKFTHPHAIPVLVDRISSSADEAAARCLELALELSDEDMLNVSFVMVPRVEVLF